jgi:hypothetical protein
LVGGQKVGIELVFVDYLDVKFFRGEVGITQLSSSKEFW